jgi:hypothetical protein
MDTATEMPVRAGFELDPENARILAERDLTFDQDKKTAVDAKQAIAGIRRNLRHAAPR